MASLFRNRFARPATIRRRRRSRSATPAMPFENLEPRLALAGDTFSRPMLERAAALVMNGPFGPNPVLITKSQVVGNDVKSFVISHVPEGSVVEKWDAVTESWIDVSTKPTSSNPQELMRLLANRLIKEGDKLQWSPKPGAVTGAREAFKLLNWDDGSDPVPRTASFPAAVTNLSARTTDVTGQLAIEWQPHEEEPVLSYTISVMPKNGLILQELSQQIAPQLYTTADTSIILHDLPIGTEYDIKVWATNEIGGGELAKVSAAIPNLRLGQPINQFWHLNQNLLPTDPVDDLGVPLAPANSNWGNSVTFPGVSYDAIMASSDENPADVPVLILPDEVITEADVDNGMTMSMWVQARGPGMLLSADYSTPSGVVTLPYMWIAPSGKVFAGFYNSESDLTPESNSSILSWSDPSTGEYRIGSMQSIESLATVIDGSWHQITFVVKGDKQALYIDGLLQGENLSSVNMQVECSESTENSENGWVLSSSTNEWTYTVPLSSPPREGGLLNLSVFQGAISSTDSSTEPTAASNTYNGEGIVPMVADASETHSKPLSLVATNLVHSPSAPNYTTISSANLISTAAGYSLQINAESKPLSTMPLQLAISYLPENSQPFAVTPSGLSAANFQPNSAVVGKSVFPFLGGNIAPQTYYPQPYRGSIAELATWSEDLSPVDIQAIATVPVLDATAGAIFHDGGVIAPVSSPDALYTFEMSDGDSVPNASPNGNVGAATAKELVTGKSTIPTPFADIPRLPNYQPFGLGLMAPLASGTFSISPPDENHSTQTIERQVALAAGDQLTLQRSNINTDPALILSITDDLGQTILQPNAFLSQAEETDQIFTLNALRTGTYKLTVEWPVGEDGQNAGNYQPIQIMYSMTPGSQNSFQNLFTSFKDLFDSNGNVLATYSDPTIPSVNDSSNSNAAAAAATGAANYFPLWSDTRYFPASTDYTTADLSQAFVALQEQVGYSIADLNGSADRAPTALQQDLQTAYQALTTTPPAGLNLDALDVVNDFFSNVNARRQTVYEALTMIWQSFESLPASVTAAQVIATTISTNQENFVVSENAGPPNINPRPKDFGEIFGSSLEKMAIQASLHVAFRKGSKLVKAGAVATGLGITAGQSAKHAGKGVTTQNSVLVNLLPVMNSQVIYEELSELGGLIDSNVIDAFSYQEAQLKNPVYLNSIYSNFGLLELMSGMSGQIYATAEANESFQTAVEQLATDQAWSQMIPDVFKWETVNPENMPVNDYNFSQLPMSSVSWEKVTPNVPSSGNANGATWLATGDLNGDHYPDIVTSNNSGSSISVLLAQPSPQWNADNNAVGYSASDPGWNYTDVAGESTTLSTDATDPSGIAVADFDGDGENEILVGSVSNSALYLIEVETTSTTIAFGTQTLINLNGGEQPQQVTVADFNQDGKPDFVTACSMTNNLVYGINQSTADSTSFDVSTPTDMSANDNVRWVTAGDLTGDNYPDLVSISYKNAGKNTIYAEVWVNLGVTDGNFNGFANPSGSTSTTFEVANKYLKKDIMATNAVIGDFDGDGYVDDFAFGMNPNGSSPDNNVDTAMGLVQFVLGSSSGPTTWTSDIGTSNGSDYLVDNAYVWAVTDPSWLDLNDPSYAIVGIAVIPAAGLPGVGADVVLASYGNQGMVFASIVDNPSSGLQLMEGSGVSGANLLGKSASNTNSQIVLDSDTGLIASVTGDATVAYTTLQTAGVSYSTVALAGTDYAEFNYQTLDALSSLGGTSGTVVDNLQVQAILHQLQSGNFVNVGPRESAGIGAPGFFVAAVDVTGAYSIPDNYVNAYGATVLDIRPRPIPEGSMAFVAWNLVDENGNPIALETLYELVGNISPATDDTEVLPTIRPNFWQAQDLDPIDPLQLAIAYNGGWFAAVEPFNNAPATYREMFFEWGRDSSDYAPNSIFATDRVLTYSAATRSPLPIATTTAPGGLAAEPGPAPGQLTISWERPEQVFGGPEAVVSYVVTVKSKDTVQTLATANTQLILDDFNFSDPFSISVQPRVAEGVGIAAQLDM
jgi:hypothetical protein